MTERRVQSHSVWCSIELHRELARKATTNKSETLLIKHALFKIQIHLYSLCTLVARFSVSLWPDSQSLCCFWGSNLRLPPLKQRRGAAAVTAITVLPVISLASFTVNYTVHCWRWTSNTPCTADPSIQHTELPRVHWSAVQCGILVL